LEDPIVIKVLDNFPDNVVAFAATGHVSKDDYDSILIPKVQEAFTRHTKVRCYYELGSEFAGMDPSAIWEDFKIGMSHLRHWERVAVVTDVKWIRLAIGAFSFLVPCEIRIFPAPETAEARRWIAAG
jgi:hypothetical protein